MPQSIDRPVFTRDLPHDLCPINVSVYTDFKAELAKFDSEDGYVHWLVIDSTRVAVSRDQTSYAVVLLILVLNADAFRTLGNV